MPLQTLTLTLTLDGITAGDYLTWCRDPDPPALGLTLRAIGLDADPLGDTITAILDWNHPPPPASVAAAAAGLRLPAGTRIRGVDSEARPQTHSTGRRQGRHTRNGQGDKHPTSARARAHLMLQAQGGASGAAR